MGNQYGTRLDEYGFEIYEENTVPLAYLLTFRTFGTWLHGDERTSIQREHDGRQRTSRLAPNVPLEESMRGELNESPTIFSPTQRKIVEAAMMETCDFRGYMNRAINVRTNHAHVVASAMIKPEKLVNDLKSYATRRLREEGEFSASDKIWSRGASTRYLWKPRHVEAAVEYVIYGKGDVPFEIVTDVPED
ncbi:MAG: transposase [Pyrinomonadaceae bacterium]